MLMRFIATIFGVVAVALLSALVSESRPGEIWVAKLSEPLEARFPIDTKPKCDPAKQEHRAYEMIDTFDRLRYRDYLILTRHRMAKLDLPLEHTPLPKPVKVSYAVVKRGGKLVAKFDGDIYFPLGNSLRGGLFSLLNNGSKQLVLSQDIVKTGAQWVADFSKGFKIIFDGQKFNVGREGDDMTISDLDGDGVYEITLPMTAFYGFEDWRLTTGSTPLPQIIFKYDPGQREYLPANPNFKECLIQNIESSELHTTPDNQQTNLGRLMSVVLDYVLVGEEERGWTIFEEACQLPDKAQIKRDMQEELRGHPVYQYLQKSERRRTAIRKIDFENFRYPGGPIYGRRGFRLKNGGFDGYQTRGDESPWGPAPISLVAIAYGDATRDGNEDAMIVLTESIHGTAIPYYIYLYQLKRNRPHLLWAVETGDRAEGGLRKVYAENGQLVIELYGQGARVNEHLYGTSSAACCPSSFTRTRYRWAKNHFTRRGESEIVPIGDQSASLEMEYQNPD